MYLLGVYSNLIGAAIERNGQPQNFKQSSRKAGYEIHHITSRSLGGTNRRSNLVYLTPREHYTAHHVLARIYGGKLSIAFHYMSTIAGVRVTSRQFETANELNRVARSEALAGKPRAWEITDEIREKIRQSLTGRKRDPAIAEKANATKLKRGTLYTEEQKEAARLRRNRLHREREAIKRTERGCLSRSEASKQLMSDPLMVERIASKLRAITLTCPHCGKTGGTGLYTWHFDYCKHNPNRKEKAKKVCPHCGLKGNGGAFTRWHFDNCKHKPDQVA